MSGAQGSLEPLFDAVQRESDACEALKASQFADLLAALKACHIHEKTTAHRLALLVFHITKNNGQPLVWLAEDIAGDSAMHAAGGRRPKPRTITAAAARLRALGIMQQTQVVEPGRGIDHAERSIDWRGVRRILEHGPPVTDPQTEAQTVAQIDPQTEAQIDPQTEAQIVAQTDPQTEAQNQGHTIPIPLNQEPTPSTADTWERARGAVLSAGVNDWRRPVEAARTAGVSPGYVIAAAEFCARSGTAHPPGHLHTRLLNAAVETQPDCPDTWLPPVDPTPRERSALALLGRAAGWAEQGGHSRDALLRTFRAKAAAEGFTRAEVSRAIFEKGLCSFFETSNQEPTR